MMYPPPVLIAMQWEHLVRNVMVCYCVASAVHGVPCSSESASFARLILHCISYIRRDVATVELRLTNEADIL